MIRIINELRRRRVFSTAALYIVASWLVMQVADTVFPAFEIPDTSLRYVLYAAVLGFPFALIVGWFYDIDASGIRRTAAATPEERVHFEQLRLMDYGILLALLAVVSAVIYGALTQLDGNARDRNASDQRAGPPVVAVLPFVSSAHAGDSEFFANGVHDDLLTQLSRLESLRVISRTSVMEYKGTTLNIREIGDQLGADVILEGGVQLAGDQIRINAQLIDARTDEHLWAQTYKRQLSPTSIFEVQEDIALAITSALNAALTVEEAEDLATLPTENMAAYRAYREARDAFGRHHLGPLRRRELLEKAVALDPGFAEAWTQLAGEYAVKSRGGDPEYTALTEETVEFIRSTWPGSTHELIATTYYLYHVIKDYDQAIQVLEQAIRRIPSDYSLLELKSWIQRRQGDLDAREATMRTLIQLNPREPALRNGLMVLLVQMHRYEDAYQEVVRAEQVGADLGGIVNALKYRADGDVTALVERMKKLVSKRSDNPYAIYNLLNAYLVAREYDLAEDLLRERLAQEPRFERLVSRAEWGLMRMFWALGREDEIVSIVEGAKAFLDQVGPKPGETVAGLWYLNQAIIAGIFDDMDEMDRWIAEWERVSSADLAERGAFEELCSLYGMSGRAEEAAACLRQSMEEPSFILPWVMPYMAEYDRVRSHPAFISLLEDWEADMAEQGITWPRERRLKSL